MKRSILLSVVLTMATVALCGIYRSDVSSKKYKDLAQAKQFDCVGLVLDKLGQNAQGSCVLIGNKYVLSAAHCFMVNDIRIDTYYVDKNGKHTDKHVEGGATIAVNQPINEHPGNLDDYSFRFNGHRYYGKQFKIFPSYLDSLKTKNIFCGDLVLIELDDTVAGVVPATLNMGFDEKNAVITGVGYGASGPGDKPGDVGPFMEKIAGQNVVDRLEGFVLNGKSTLLSCDFDAPGRTDCNRMGAAKPLPLEWAPGGGDSGGGLFTEVKGKWQLVGIITGGPNSGVDMEQYMKTKGFYGGITQNVRVSVFNQWIRETTAEFEKAEVKLEFNLK